MGRWQAFHGLLIDQLESARVVTANGDVVTASASEHDDLFWGLCGGGMHLGVVTQATYRVADLTNDGNIQSADLLFSFDTTEDVFEALEGLKPIKPRELAVTVYAFWNPMVNAVSPYPPLILSGRFSYTRRLSANDHASPSCSATSSTLVPPARSTRTSSPSSRSPRCKATSKPSGGTASSVTPSSAWTRSKA